MQQPLDTGVSVTHSVCLSLLNNADTSAHTKYTKDANETKEANEAHKTNEAKQAKETKGH